MNTVCREMRTKRELVNERDRRGRRGHSLWVERTEFKLDKSVQCAERTSSSSCTEKGDGKRNGKL